MAKALCQFWIKIDQNALDKIAKFELRDLGVLSGSCYLVEVHSQSFLI